MNAVWVRALLIWNLMRATQNMILANSAPFMRSHDYDVVIIVVVVIVVIIIIIVVILILIIIIIIIITADNDNDGEEPSPLNQQFFKYERSSIACSWLQVA